MESKIKEDIEEIENLEKIEEKEEVEDENQIEAKVKKPRTQKQIEAFNKVLEIRNEKRNNIVLYIN